MYTDCWLHVAGEENLEIVGLKVASRVTEMQGYSSPQGYPDPLLTPSPNMDRKR
jgi:hypothetical protein